MMRLLLLDNTQIARLSLDRMSYTARLRSPTYALHLIMHIIYHREQQLSTLSSFPASLPPLRLPTSSV